MMQPSDSNLHSTTPTESESRQPQNFLEVMEAVALHSAENTEVSAEELQASINKPRCMETVLLSDGTTILPQNGSSTARREIQEAENLAIERRKKYEADRLFFEQHVLKKSRSVVEIQEDYIKILHPHYREKFLAGLEKYGTVAAALKYMKDTYGIRVRTDLLNRMQMMIPAFKTEIEDSIAMYQATIQMALHKRAIEGVEKHTYDREGNIIATDRVYSDTLLAKLADTHNPEYKEAKQKEGARGNTINVQIIKDFHNYKG